MYNAVKLSNTPQRFDDSEVKGKHKAVLTFGTALAPTS